MSGPAASEPGPSAALVQRKRFAQLAGFEQSEPAWQDPLDLTRLHVDPPSDGAAIQRKASLEPAADPVQDRGRMPHAVPSPLQRRASMSAMDAPRTNSLSADRATIGAAPAAPAAGAAESDAPRADSPRADRATIAADFESAPGPLSPARAARAAAKNPASVTLHGITGADFGTDAAPDSVAFAQAVARFQQQHGLAVDGIVGPATAAALRGNAAPTAEGSGHDTVASEAAPETDTRGAGSSLLQMKGNVAGTNDAVHRAAAAGIASGGQPLPHLTRIQQSFGAHDVSAVHAHVGGVAADATAAMGAEAYATGNDVAFADSPDLHTAAHEAAHVVQQRAGVQLKGGVGEAGDPYEQHADAVADAVVRGDSAESLLDAKTGVARATAESDVLQLKNRGATGRSAANGGPEGAAERSIFDDDERVKVRIRIIGNADVAGGAFAAALGDVRSSFEAIDRAEQEFKGLVAQIAIGMGAGFLARGITNVVRSLSGKARRALATTRTTQAPARTGGIRSEPLYALGDASTAVARSEASNPLNALEKHIIEERTRSALRAAEAQVRAVFGQGGRWAKNFISHLPGESEMTVFLNSLTDAHLKYRAAIVQHATSTDDDLELLSFLMMVDPATQSYEAFRTGLFDLATRYRSQVEPVGTHERDLAGSGRPRGPHQTGWDVFAARVWHIEPEERYEGVALVKGKQVNTNAGHSTPHVVERVEFVRWIESDMAPLALEKSKQARGGRIPMYQASYVHGLDWSAENTPLREEQRKRERQDGILDDALADIRTPKNDGTP